MGQSVTSDPVLNSCFDPSPDLTFAFTFSSTLLSLFHSSFSFLSSFIHFKLSLPPFFNWKHLRDHVILTMLSFPLSLTSLSLSYFFFFLSQVSKTRLSLKSRCVMKLIQILTWNEERWRKVKVIFLKLWTAPFGFSSFSLLSLSLSLCFTLSLPLFHSIILLLLLPSSNDNYDDDDH